MPGTQSTELQPQLLIKALDMPGMVAHAFNPSTWEADLCEFKTSLVHRASSRTADATQRNPIWERKNKGYAFLEFPLAESARLSLSRPSSCVL